VFGAQQVAQWPKERQLILDGAVVPLESFQEQQRSMSPSSAAGAPSKDGGTGPGEIVVTIKQGKWSADLFRQSLSGSGYKTVELVVPGKDGKGIRIILSDVLISSYSVSDADGRGDAPLESLSLSFRKREFSQDPPPPRR
jgi:type VI protein secretion system component Hcp